MSKPHQPFFQRISCAHTFIELLLSCLKDLACADAPLRLLPKVPHTQLISTFSSCPLPTSSLIPLLRLSLPSARMATLPSVPATNEPCWIGRLPTEIITQVLLTRRDAADWREPEPFGTILRVIKMGQVNQQWREIIIEKLHAIEWAGESDPSVQKLA